MSNASYVSARGWGVGTVLSGSEIVDAAVGREPAKQRIITAIGQAVVVARDRIRLPDGEYGHWGSERFASFDAREWHPVDTCRGCWKCVELELSLKPYPDNIQWPFIVCHSCGNKRCPRATDHNEDCTRSNEPGQPGSRY